jgi:hypothetical protein
MATEYSTAEYFRRIQVTKRSPAQATIVTKCLFENTPDR